MNLSFSFDHRSKDLIITTVIARVMTMRSFRMTITGGTITVVALVGTTVLVFFTMILFRMAIRMAFRMVTIVRMVMIVRMVRM